MLEEYIRGVALRSWSPALSLREQRDASIHGLATIYARVCETESGLQNEATRRSCVALLRTGEPPPLPSKAVTPAHPPEGNARLRVRACALTTTGTTVTIEEGDVRLRVRACPAGLKQNTVALARQPNARADGHLVKRRLHGPSPNGHHPTHVWRYAGALPDVPVIISLSAGAGRTTGFLWPQAALFS